MNKFNAFAFKHKRKLTHNTLKRYFFTLLVLCVFCNSLEIYAANHLTFEKSHIQIRFEDKATYSFEVELADSSKKRERGLMYRKELNEESGMLFIFPQKQIVAMWMKDTYIPLDMLFFDQNKKLVYIKENAKPHSLDTISYPFPIRYVLELKGGTVKEKGIMLGSHMIYSQPK